MNLKQYIKDIPDFPKKGILFRDIQPLLADADAFTHACMQMSELDEYPDYWVGIESRGFIFAAGIAAMRQGGFKMIRKEGKLPGKKINKIFYKYEYSEGALEMEPGKGKIVLVDDVYATGGTMESAEEMAICAGYDVIGKICLLDIGIAKPKGVKSLIKYE
jgi:adenine phosphoribosyltransferase